MQGLKKGWAFRAGRNAGPFRLKNDRQHSPVRKRGHSMNTKLYGPSISRRGFLAFAGAASSLALLAPRQLFAQDDGLVQMARRSAASANITVQKLRGNISVLMVAGGNIAVLPGPDGKLMIYARFAGSRPKLTKALASISSEPIKQLIDTHCESDNTHGNECFPH